MRPLPKKRVTDMDTAIWKHCVGRDVSGQPGAIHYGGHSYRIGGATALMDKGCPPATLQGLGRWVSACYLLYLRVGTETLHKWQRKMVLVGDNESSHTPGCTQSVQHGGGD